MWQLARPDTSDVRKHLGLALKVTPAATAQEIDDIIALYDAYETDLGRPSDALKGEALRPDLLEAIRDAYGCVQDNGSLSDLRSALKLSTDECPYCGFGQVQDLDHHLPKAVFKPFSIFPLNLVPSCATCNRGKTRKPGTDPAKHLFNVYLEPKLTFQFLVARALIDPASGALLVQFSIRPSQPISGELLDRLKNHLVEFDLETRFPAQVNIYLGTLEVSLVDNYDSGGAVAVENFLRRSADASAKRNGLNDWRTALLHAVAECREFCDGGFSTALGY